MTDPIDPRARQRRADAEAIFAAAVRAADPRRCVERVLSVQGGNLIIAGTSIPLAERSRLLVIGAGKATPAMAGAAEAVLGERIAAGAINTKYDHAVPLSRIRTTECGHPVPDAEGVRGTGRILDLLAQVDRDTLVLCLFSGGGSALLPAPAEGLTLADKQETTRLLLACGATIDEINTMRKHLSEVKGGQLARRAQPARVISLLLSDVIGDPLDTIASGPTHPDPTTFADCLELMTRYRLLERLPAPARTRLEAGATSRVSETPKPGDPCFARTETRVIGNNALALDAAREEAVRRGYQPLVLSSRIQGEAREVAAVYAALAQEACTTGQPVPAPACIIGGGETTVTLRGTGRGGRNQELALAAAVRLAGWGRVTLLSAGTDGTDGPTDAAGAVVDGSTVERARQRGFQAADHLDRNDAYPLLAGTGDLLVTGATGTNVMDLQLVLVSPA
ncbi:MAG: glycerate kinase [Candidatus Latescibacterota bacterium]|jgi:hydroxypyruvate reductase